MMKQIFVMLLVLFSVPAFTQERSVPLSRGQVTLTFAPLVKRTAPAVVNVYAKSIVQQQVDQGPFSDPFFRKFFGQEGGFGPPRERVANSLGSGVIVDPSGIIVTNNHVIKNGTDIRVALPDKREFKAKIVLADERTDLAVLKIDVGDEDLPALTMGNSDNLEVGDLVLAIGNPFGVGQTVTSGIVSALARTSVGITDYQFFIQTDAAINPGNSGGALVNMKGELIGINSAIYSRSGGSVGIGFSIPSNMVQNVVQTAEAGQKIVRPWLGAGFQDVTADLADTLGFARPEGALIAEMHPQSPLALAGLRRGDVIVAIDGKLLENAREISYFIATSHVGETRVIEYRRNQYSRQTSIRLIAAPETISRQSTVISGGTPLAGVVAADFKPGPALQFFRKGDVLLNINGAVIDSVDTLRGILEQNPRKWQIQFLRGGQKIFLRLG
jgi:Do/DeqQ family serine protease